MRIQHNIMAMNAYRNYTNNVAAMKANLEKLSSGYKINRAGDDAAGLAISEKMRAQITGLQTAQKNAKDGISLVQTAEGAMTEVHSMLNRMVELATQSANGTYDDTTDRYQLQKEMDQLKSEINRIADSANFNGIKLLDGTMDGEAIPGELVNVKAAAAGAADPALPEAGARQVLGTDTVLHKGAGGATSASFGIALHNVSFSNDAANGVMTIKFGDDEITLSGGATKGTMSTGSILTDLTDNNPRTMSVGTKDYVVEGDTLEAQLNSWVSQFNKDAAANGNGAIVAEAKGGSILFSSTDPTQGATVGNTKSVGGNNLTNGQDAVAQVNTATITFAVPTDGSTITIGSTTYTFHDNDTAKVTAGTTGVDINGWDADAAANWATKALGDAGAFEVSGFDSPTAPDGTAKTVDLTASTKAAATTANGLGATDTQTALNAKIGQLVQGGTITAAVAQKTQGKDNVAATYNTGAMTRLNPTLEIAGYKVEVSSTKAEDQLNEFITAYNKDKTNQYTAKLNAAGDGIDFTAKEAGVGPNTAGDVGATNAAGFTYKATAVVGQDSALGTNKAMDAKAIIEAIKGGYAQLNGNPLTTGDIANGVTLNDGATYDLSFDGDKITFTQQETDKDPLTGEINSTILDRQVEVTGTLNAATQKNTVSGDYNVSTTVNVPNSADSGERLASTYFTMTSDKVVDGASVFIGGKNYTFTTDKAAADKDTTKVYIKDLLNDKGVVEDADLETVNERISVAAKGNEVYTVGYDKNRLTFTENVGYTTGKQEYDLTQLSEIERSLGFTAAPTPSEYRGLTLQIGDTADEYNKLTVNIRDMHAKSLGLDDISIDTQDAAAVAVDVIKKAINTVSDVRGTLGATQNRLDHTINNLSVMTENIQDAESTIRDTDVAAEMMAYTKNNILIQSAQAMLAQANQVPQGVLQLLQ